MKEPITSMSDPRLPQPNEWTILPPELRDHLYSLRSERRTCSRERWDEIEREWIELLEPYARTEVQAA